MHHQNCYQSKICHLREFIQNYIFVGKNGFYTAPTSQPKNFFKAFRYVRCSLDLYSADYNQFIIIGDFKAELNQEYMKLFCESYNLKSFIKGPTCFKNRFQHPLCIDLILINSPYNFLNSRVTETGVFATIFATLKH